MTLEEVLGLFSFFPFSCLVVFPCHRLSHHYHHQPTDPTLHDLNAINPWTNPDQKVATTLLRCKLHLKTQGTFKDVGFRPVSRLSAA